MKNTLDAKQSASGETRVAFGFTFVAVASVAQPSAG